MNRKIRWSSLALLAVCAAIFFPLAFGPAESRSAGGACAVAVGAAVFCVDFIRSMRAGSGQVGKNAVRVSFDEASISAVYGDGDRRSIPWADLTKVGITTTDEGPFVDDVFWGLHAGDVVAVVYPSEAVGAGELLRALQERLVGFDNERLVEAMGCSTNARFLIWERPRDPGEVAA